VISKISHIISNIPSISLAELSSVDFESRIDTQIIQYEKIENIHPDRTNGLISDLEERTGNEIVKFDVLESDYLRDAVKQRIYYKPANR
jgi:hypothetical protein